ncbi:MAG: leucyl/phenylalanyl-tRNA--protein transferase [Micavibrio sp.]
MRNKTITSILLDAYREGVFPMAESAEDEGFAFYRPHMRGLLPIADLHIPARLLKTLRKAPFTVTRDKAFERIIALCAEATGPKRGNTWINAPIQKIYGDLHRQGHAHSIECWNKDGALAGGLYGVRIGAVFCGESMVSLERDASKVALVHLAALLWEGGFEILDTQFINPHLLQFGAYEIPQEEYEKRIGAAMEKECFLPEKELPEILKDYLDFRLSRI